MKHISIIVPNGKTILSSIIGPYKIFKSVNDYLIDTKQRSTPFFDVKLVGLTPSLDVFDGAFTIRTDCNIDDVHKTDLIIIPAIMGDIVEEINNNMPFLSWIKQHYAQGAELASFCLGSFILASTGLMSGKKCTTHWMGAANFRQMFPDVELIPEKVVTDQEGIYTSGGAYSFLNLVIYLVEKYVGRETALWCSKVFEIEMDRTNQSQFVIFNGQKDHEDDQVKRAQLYIEDNYREKIGINQLANQFAISRRHFIRRFKKATANTPLEYVQRVKIEAAKKSLESTAFNINEVMYDVGYNDSKAFRNVFKKITGLSPTAYRLKYNRVLAKS